MKNILIKILLTAFIISCDSSDLAETTLTPQEPYKVLILGDSITLNYQTRVDDLLDGEVYHVFFTERNQVTSENFLNRIQESLALSDSELDVIHFNVGLHDMVRTPTINDEAHATLLEYQSNLVNIVEAMREHSPNSIIIFGTSTPVFYHSNLVVSDVEMFNDAARLALTSKGVIINEIHDNIQPYLEDLIGSDGLHFTPQGDQVNADLVAEVIQRAVD